MNFQNHQLRVITTKKMIIHVCAVMITVWKLNIFNKESTRQSDISSYKSTHLTLECPCCDVIFLTGGKAYLQVCRVPGWTQTVQHEMTANQLNKLGLIIYYYMNKYSPQPNPCFMFKISARELTAWNSVLLQKVTATQLVRKSNPFIWPNGWPCSQQLAAGPYSERDASSPHLLTLFP
jgi:hypothetical protein